MPTVAVFDFDKTLTTADTFRLFLVVMSGRARVYEAAIRYLPGRLRGLGDSGGRDAARERVLGRLLRGVPAVVYRRKADEFADRVVRDLLRDDTVERLRWHQEQGHRIIIVSGSLDRYVELVGAHLGVEDVIATALEIDPGGRLTGRLLGPNVRTHEKARRLRGLLGEQPVAYAYGDSEGDREMLAMAERAYWVTRDRLVRAP